MYIQITTRCNMTCEHCCYACNMNGEDMSMATFKKVMELCECSNISLGGGEPTLHPNFWEMLGISIGVCDGVWLATNGSTTDTALALAKMASKGVIGCALSQDPWHDEIDERVVKAFTPNHKRASYVGYNENNEDHREIRNVSNSDMAPWRDPEDGGAEGNCPCDTIMTRPSGDVFACGCVDAPKIGNVNDGFELPDEWNWGMCYREQECLTQNA